MVFLAFDQGAPRCCSGRCGWHLSAELADFPISLLGRVHHFKLLKEHALLRQCFLKILNLLHLLGRDHKLLLLISIGNLFLFLLLPRHQMLLLLFIFFDLFLADPSQQQMIL